MIEALAHGYTSAHPVAAPPASPRSICSPRTAGSALVNGSAGHFGDLVHALKGRPHVTDIRSFGLAAGLTIAALPGEPARRPFEIAMKCLEQGVYVRFGGDTIQLAPPFISTKAELERLVSVLADALDAVA
ncbi:MAG: hypothetical protein R2939_11130 [Kofleriaceae bacterium]